MLPCKIRILRGASLAVAALLCLVPADSTAQDATRTFALVSGNDTVSVETLQRSPGHMEGELVVPRASGRWVYKVDLAADGLVTSLQTMYNSTTDTSGAPPRQKGLVRFDSDSIRVTVQAGLLERSLVFPKTPGAMPYFNPSMAMLELAIQRALGLGSDTASIELFTVEAGQYITIKVTRVAPDSVVADLGGVAARLAVNPQGDVRGGTIPSQDIAIVVHHGGHGLAREIRDYSPPEGAPYTAREVTVPTPEGFMLAGTLTLPNGASATRKAPAVITITGSGPQDRDETISIVLGYRPFYELADTLGRRGIAVLRMDDRGTFASKGDFATSNTADFADDIRAALTWLRQQPEIDTRRIALVGHSEGGMVAPMVAAGDPTLKGIVLLAGPSQTGRKILTYQNRFRLDADSSLSPSQRDSALTATMQGIDSAAANSPWLAYFLSYDPVAAARKVRVPVLVLQGETDRQVTAEQAPALGKAFKAGGNRDVTVKLYPNTNHLFVEDPDGSPMGYSSLPTSKVRPEVLSDIASWVALHFKK